VRVLIAVLAAAALVAGITGAWSPCGFSMVETLAPSGYAGRLRTTAIACATFALGALAGGVITFGGLASIGDALGAGAPAVAALIAIAAAAGEANGARIVPQVRRQVPESWRRKLPVPLAAGLYGILLGLGFTTFILTFAVWALAATATALGDPQAGLAIGLGFGAGRALPVIALAPRGGGALHAKMAEQPRILRSLRIADALALAATAAALIATPAQAAVTPIAFALSDPSVDGTALALHRPGATGEIRGPNSTQITPGSHPAVGGGHVAWIENGQVVVAGVMSIAAPAADSVAVNDRYVAWRAGTALFAAALAPDATPQLLIDGDVGRPALGEGSLVVFENSGRIDAIDLTTNVRTTLRRQARAELRGPAIADGALSYVMATYKRQQVRIGPLIPQKPANDFPVYGTWPTGYRDLGYEPGHEHAEGHKKQLWPRPPKGVQDTLTTTALAPDAVYVTRVRKRAGKRPTPAVLRIDRP
jgi:hypothetical protein